MKTTCEISDSAPCPIFCGLLCVLNPRIGTNTWRCYRYCWMPTKRCAPVTLGDHTSLHLFIYLPFKLNMEWWTRKEGYNIIHDNVASAVNHLTQLQIGFRWFNSCRLVLDVPSVHRLRQTHRASFRGGQRGAVSPCNLFCIHRADYNAGGSLLWRIKCASRPTFWKAALSNAPWHLLLLLPCC